MTTTGAGAPATREEEVRFLREYVSRMSARVAGSLLDATGGLAALIEICQRRPRRLDVLLPDRPALVRSLLSTSWDRADIDYDLHNLLRGAELEPHQIQALLQQFGTRPLQRLLRTRPWEICRVPQIGFASAERVARAAAAWHGRALPVLDPDRMMYALREVVGRFTREGHTCMPEEGALASAKRLLVLDPDRSTESALRGGLDAAARQRLLIREWGMVYPKALHRAECEVAEMLARMVRQGTGALGRTRRDLHGRLAAKGLTEEQVEAGVRILSSPVCILEGGPGRGKSTMLRAVLDILDEERRTHLRVAPTGKAAQRASQVTGRPWETIHAAFGLKGEPTVHERFSADDPITTVRQDVVVAEEASMIPLVNFHALLKRCRPGRTCLLLVGDPNQLPAVEPGQVLKDLGDSGRLPVARLTQVLRTNNRELIDAADAILEGRLPRFERDGHRLRLFDPGVRRGRAARDGSEILRDWLLQAVVKYTEDLSLNPFRDIQVFSPQKNGTLGLWSLNPALQALLNPPRDPDPPAAKIEGGFAARVGDRVIMTRTNSALATAGGAPCRVRNGMMGRVVQITTRKGKPTSVTVEFDDLEEPVVFRESREWRSLAPGYAISVHRSQGSEVAYSFIAMDGSMNPRLISRTLIFTAHTRAQQGVAYFTPVGVLRRGIANTDGTERITTLPRRLQQALAGADEPLRRRVRLRSATAGEPK